MDVQAAGVMINTMGWIEGLGYELLLHSIEALKADVILVVGQERLYNQLRNHLRYAWASCLPKKGFTVLPLHKLMVSRADSYLLAILENHSAQCQADIVS